MPTRSQDNDIRVDRDARALVAYAQHLGAAGLTEDVETDLPI